MDRSSATLSQPQRDRASKFACSLLLALMVSLPLNNMAVAATEEELLGPDITIIATEEKTIYEYRQAGQLRMVKIIPAWGKPYFLVPRDPTKGFGDLERADMLLPSWVIIEF